MTSLPRPSSVLDALPRVAWRRVGRNGATTKPPVGRGGRIVDATDPANWLTRADVATLIAAGLADGEGVPLGHGVAGLDLDEALDRDGALRPWARALLAPFAGATWIERSPGGRGVHVLGLATLPRNVVRTGLGADGKGRAELFGARKFFTLTYDRLPESAPDVGDVQDAFAALAAAWTARDNDPAPPPTAGHREKSNAGDAAISDASPEPLADDAVLVAAFAATNGAKFRRLFVEGDLSGHGGDHSRADAALAAMLAFWTPCDAQLARLFSRSALGQRPKWRERADYRARTLAWARRAQPGRTAALVSPCAAFDLSLTFQAGRERHDHAPDADTDATARAERLP